MIRKHISPHLLFLIFLSATCSCKTDDINPDQISNEIKISCHLTDLSQVPDIEDTTENKVWITIGISNGCFDRKFNSYGQCWTLNTDILPTIKSEKNEVSWANTTKSAFRQTKEGIDLYFISPVQCGIPVSVSDTKLIVRGFVIFNDTLVRYSDPLVIVNPFNYAI